MNTTALSLQLTKEDAAFLEEYARKHNLSVDAFIGAYIRELKVASKFPLDAEIKKSQDSFLRKRMYGLFTMRI